MKVSAASDYALRAAVVLAASEPGKLVKGDVIAEAQGISFRFCEQLLGSLRKAGIVTSQRGADGGYALARPADQINVAEVIRAIDGPIAVVHGQKPEDIDYPPPAEAMRELWVATRAALRTVIEVVTLADLAAGVLPESVRARLDDPDAWSRR